MPENSEEQNQNGFPDQEEQIAEAYRCSCGEVFSVDQMKEFRSHVMRSSLADGKGTHKSQGRVNLKDGKVVVPPWAVLSVEQKKLLKHSRKTDNEGNGSGTNKGAGPQGFPGARVNDPAQAQAIRVVPKVYTMDYSPIMRAAQDAAITYFGWRPDMPLGNFLDTCLYMFFEEKGITLCGYIVDDTLLQKEEQHAS